MARPRLVAVLLVLLLTSVAAPAQSQNDDETPRRWPYFETEAAILPPAGQQVFEFGHQVDTDGDRVIVAASDAAYVYGRDRATWTLEATLAPSTPGAPVRAVALDSGFAIVAGGGTVDTWHRDAAGTWDFAASLPRYGSGFGAAMVARDGTLVVTEPDDSALAQIGQAGRAHVFTLTASGDGWAHRQTLTEPSDTVRRAFGADVALTADTLVVGAPGRPLTNQVAPGAAYVYERTGTTWSRTGDIVASAGSEAESTFGHDVATSGAAVLVSTAYSPAGSAQETAGGDVYFYEREADGDGWEQVQWESTESTAVAAKPGVALATMGFWNVVSVYVRAGDDLDCSWGPWCQIGILGGFDDWFSDDNVYPEDMALRGRVAVLGAPGQRVDDDFGAVFAYYDNAVPRAWGQPRKPVNDLDGDGREPVTLDGSLSYDPDGTIVRHTWLRDGQRLGDGTFLDLTLPLGTHRITLEVEDDLGAIGSDTFNVVVREPHVDVSFDYCCDHFRRGVFPSDPTWFWPKVDDHRANVRHWEWDFDGDGTADSTRQYTEHAFPHGGNWPVTLTVTNEAGNQETATRNVPAQNAPPEADAGPPQVAQTALAGLASITLDGSASTDPDGTITDYEWWDTDGPGQGGSTPVGTGKTFTVQRGVGVHDFLLVASDDDGDDDRAWTRVVVIEPGQNATGNAPRPNLWTEDLGDRTVRLHDDTLVGDAPIAIRIWSLGDDERSGGPEHDVPVDGPGQHTAQLTVIDADGREGTWVEDFETTDAPPTPKAWPLDGTISVGGYVTFMGYVEDEAPDSVAWSWSIDGAEISDHQDVGYTFHQVGTHAIRLQVTDDQGQTAALDGALDVLSEEDYRLLVEEGNLENRTLEEDGIFTEPEGSIAADLERRQALQGDDDPDDAADDAADDNSRLPGALDDQPRTNANTAPLGGPGGLPVWAWILLGLLAIMLAVGGNELRRTRARAKRRRARYEAAFRARLQKTGAKPPTPPPTNQARRR